jgi:hypothetical protein
MIDYRWGRVDGGVVRGHQGWIGMERLVGMIEESLKIENEILVLS